MRWLPLGLILSTVAVSCSLDREGLGSGETGVGATGGSSVGGTSSQGGAGGTPETGGTGALGGESGTGGSSGAGASGGSGGTAGTAGMAGTSGTAGMAGVAGTGTGGTGPIFDPPWWNTQWRERWPIQIHNPCDKELVVGYQIGLRTDGYTLSPTSSWRILRWNGSSWSDIPRLVEQVGAATWVWFGATAPIPPQSGDDSYWLYADNSTAVQPPAPTGLFDFLEDFGASEPGSWTTTGNVSFHAGYVRLDGAGVGGSIRSNVKFGPDHAIDFAMTVEKPMAYNSRWFCGGFQREQDFTDTVPWILWISRSSASVRSEFWNGAGIQYNGKETGVDTGVEHVYGIERFPRRNVFLRDHQEFDVYSFSTDYSTPLQIRFTAYTDSILHVRYARIRKACDPRPEGTLGSAEVWPL